MQEVRESTTLQWIVDGQRWFVQVKRFDYLYTVSCDNNEAFGEGFTLEDAMEMFMKNWEDYNQYGPH